MFHIENIRFNVKHNDNKTQQHEIGSLQYRNFYLQPFPRQ